MGYDAEGSWIKKVLAHKPTEKQEVKRTEVEKASATYSEEGVMLSNDQGHLTAAGLKRLVSQFEADRPVGLREPFPDGK